MRDGVHIMMLPAVLLLTACSAFKAPAITVEGVSITEVTDDAMALAFAIDLQNSNDEPLELVEFRYTLSIDGTQVYAGRRRPDADVAARQTQRISLPAVIPFDRAGWTGGVRPPQAKYAVAGRIVYTAPSTIAQMLFDLGVRRPKSSFSKQGRLALD